MPVESVIDRDVVSTEWSLKLIQERLFGNRFSLEVR